MRILMHGTTMSKAVSILKNGFVDGDHNWDVSEPEVFYFIDSEKNESFESSMEKTFFHGCLVSFLEKKRSEEVAILFFEAGEDVLPAISDDLSCNYAEASQLYKKETEKMKIIGVSKTKISPAHEIAAFLMVSNNTEAEMNDAEFEKEDLLFIKKAFSLNEDSYEMLYEKAQDFKWADINELLGLPADVNPEEASLFFQLSDVLETDVPKIFEGSK